MTPVTPSRPGHCSRCDAPLSATVRVTFETTTGTPLEASFCEPCADGMKPRDYRRIWERMVLAWLRETRGRITPWLAAQGERGLVKIVGRR